MVVGVPLPGTSLPFTLRKGKEHTRAPDRDTAKTALKRTQWEQFSFDVNAPDSVELINKSHENPADHQYTVSIDDVTGETTD